jgi:hypothetical protein
VERDQKVNHRGLDEGKESCDVLGPQGDAAKEPATPAKGSPRTSEINGSRTLDAIAAAAGANGGPVKLGGVRTRPQQQQHSSPKPVRKGRQENVWRARSEPSSMTAMATTTAAHSETTVRIK